MCCGQFALGVFPFIMASPFVDLLQKAATPRLMHMRPEPLDQGVVVMEKFRRHRLAARLLLLNGSCGRRATIVLCSTEPRLFLGRLNAFICLPLRGGQQNRIAEERLKRVQTAVLPLAVDLLSAVHAPGPAHDAHSIGTFARHVRGLGREPGPAQDAFP